MCISLSLYIDIYIYIFICLYKLYIERYGFATKCVHDCVSKVGWIAWDRLGLGVPREGGVTMVTYFEIYIGAQRRVCDNDDQL